MQSYGDVVSMRVLTQGKSSKGHCGENSNCCSRTRTSVITRKLALSTSLRPSKLEEAWALKCHLLAALRYPGCVDLALNPDRVHNSCQKEASQDSLRLRVQRSELNSNLDPGVDQTWSKHEVLFIHKTRLGDMFSYG